MKSNNNLIPQAATVTLPAGEYYALIRSMENLIKVRDTQTEAIKVNAENDRVVLEHSDIIPYAQELRDRVAKLLSENDDAMEILVRRNEYMYAPRSSYLSSYSWHGPDLREAYPSFAKAWGKAEMRLEAQTLAEEAAETEDNDGTAEEG